MIIWFKKYISDIKSHQNREKLSFSMTFVGFYKNFDRNFIKKQSKTVQNDQKWFKMIQKWFNLWSKIRAWDQFYTWNCVPARPNRRDVSIQLVVRHLEPYGITATIICNVWVRPASRGYRYMFSFYRQQLHISGAAAEMKLVSYMSKDEPGRCYRSWWWLLTVRGP